MSKRPHISFESIEKMPTHELKGLISRHPEMIPDLAQELLKKKRTKKVPKVTNKLIQCITSEDMMRSEAVERLFKILELNNFLGLDCNRLLKEALEHKNFVLATKLVEHGATFDQSVDVDEVVATMKALIHAGPFLLFNACIDYFLNFHEEELEAKGEQLAEIFTLAFNNPHLSDCKVEVKTKEGNIDEIWINTKLLSMPREGHPPLDEVFLEALQEHRDEESEALVELLRFCYRGEVVINQSNVKELLIASHRYKVPMMHKKCEQWVFDHYFPNAMESEKLLELGKMGGSLPLLDWGFGLAITQIKDVESYLKDHGEELTGINCSFWEREQFSLIPLLGKYCPNLQRMTLPSAFDERDLALLNSCDQLKMIDIPHGASIFSRAIEETFPQIKVHSL